MSSLRTTNGSTGKSSDVERLAELIDGCDSLVVGAGAGLSTSAGFQYSGERFRESFADFEDRFGFHDMYSGSFYDFPDSETAWAYMSRMIKINRYDDIPGTVYSDLLALVKDRDYFVITTNVDHCFQRTGFDKDRLFYTQGDYGLFQCSVPCSNKTYDNEDTVRKMISDQQGMRIPSDLVPHCPNCGKEMTMNLRKDDKFVQDLGWYKANDRYEQFVFDHRHSRTLFLELGVGFNTPAIIKYPFWGFVNENPNAYYAIVNLGQAYIPSDIADRSLALDADISSVISELRKILNC